MSIGVSAIGSTRPFECVDVVAQQLPQSDDQQVADHVVAHLTVAGESMLQHSGPGVAPAVVSAQRRKRHPQVAGREHPELAAQPPGRAAVVRDGDDRGQLVDGEVVDQQPQRRERGVQPVPSPERHDRLGAVGAFQPWQLHSRPRSRWLTLAS
jgi:hypothetical protein